MDQMPVLVLPVDRVSIARLHGEACIYCGSTKPPFEDAGYVDTKSGGSVLSWRVVSCSRHGTEGRDEPSSEAAEPP